MSPTVDPTLANRTRTPLWSAPMRLLHWLTAAGMMGAAVVTTQGDPAHEILGWAALSVLLVWHIGPPWRHRPAPALDVVTLVLVAMSASGWLAPAGDLHAGFTLAAAILASLYGATVLFEALRRVELRWLREA